jgi:DNA-binding protein H-NS
MNNKYTSDNTAAALRLEKAKKVKSKEVDSAKQQQAATERDDANEKLFQQFEENKKKAVSYKEYLKKKNEKAE